MINNKKDLKEYISIERNKYSVRFIDKIFSITEQAILLKFQIRLRKTEYYKNTNKRIRYFFSMLKLLKMKNKYCLHIPLNTCGKGLKIMHLGPILINGKASIGNNCSIHINVAIVAGGTNDFVPKIGNDVVLGVGCTVLGGVSIANGIAVGAGAVVNKSFEEENICIAGVPANKISDNGKFKWSKTIGK